MAAGVGGQRMTPTTPHVPREGTMPVGEIFLPDARTGLVPSSKNRLPQFVRDT